MLVECGLSVFEFCGNFQNIGVGFVCGLCVSFHVCEVSLCVGCV